MPALFARKANNAMPKFSIHGVRRSLITLFRVGSFRAGRRGALTMRKLLTLWIARAVAVGISASSFGGSMMLIGVGKAPGGGGGGTPTFNQLAAPAWQNIAFGSSAAMFSGQNIGSVGTGNYTIVSV
jgi:hypothetical protein